MSRKWVKLGIIVDVLTFIILTHITFGLTPPANPQSIDVYMLYVAWGLSGLNLMMKTITGCFGILFEKTE